MQASSVFDGEPKRTDRTMSDMSYREEFAGVLDALTSVPHADSPEQVIHVYAQLVDMIRDGYGWEWAEYDNDMWIRDAIEALLNVTALNAYVEFDSFRRSVAVQDALLDSALSAERIFPNRVGWWRQRVPRRAVGDLLRELRVLFDYEAIDGWEPE